MEEAEEIRRKNLVTLIDQRGGKAGGTTRLSEETGIAAAQISQWVNRSLHSATGKPRTMRGDSARKIERALSLPPNWMDTRHHDDDTTVSTPATTGHYVRVQQLDAEAGMGDARVNDDYPEVIRAMDFEPDYIRSIVGFVPVPGRLVLVTGTGDSMLPTIQPGDVVVVDRGVTSFDGDGLYLINMGNGHQIKRLIDKGVIHVASDNREKNGDPFPIPKGTLIGGRVYLRNRIERFN